MAENLHQKYIFDFQWATTKQKKNHVHVLRDTLYKS